MTSAREDLELQKLSHELVETSKQSRRPWLLQVAVPALVASLASGVGGYVFGDSLVARNRAEIRKDIFTRYFGVDNRIAGKRKQILDFIDATMIQDDPVLAAWSRKERAVIESLIDDQRQQIYALDAEIMDIETKLEVWRSEDANRFVIGAAEGKLERLKQERAAREGESRWLRLPPSPIE
jgi:hypothetical protein